MIGYRYSFVQIGQSLGLDVGTKSIPKYQDWVYNIQLAKGKAGKFNFFGMGGISNIDFIGKDIDTTDFYARQDQDGYSTNNFTVVGAKHTIDVSSKSYIKTVISYASSKADYDQYQYALPLTYSHRWLNYQVKSSSTVVRASSFINTKFNAKISWRSGLLAELFHTSSYVISRDGKPETAPFQVQQNYTGNSSLLQAYSQLRYKPTNNLTFIGGLHAMLYTANQSNAIEPRFGINYQLRKNSFLFNYGLHSQMQPLPVYYTQSVNSAGVVNDGNKNLGFTKAHHLVLGYERRFTKDWRVKAETYYQYLYNVPVEVAATGFSILNAGADFTFPDKAGLVNKGTGINYGAELTVEKFLSKGLYVLSSTSVFSSKYKGSDGIERNTTFNYGYAANILAGKEWKMGKANKNAFTMDFKLTTIGGRYATPIDMTASVAQNKEVLDETKYNSNQLKGYFRMDTKFGFRINSNKHKLSHTFYLDLQNVTNNKNIFYAGITLKNKPLAMLIRLVSFLIFYTDYNFKIDVMNFFEALQAKNAALAIFGYSCLLGALLCGVLAYTTNIQVNNINAFIKPTKFFLSIAVYAFTMGWYCSYLPQFNTSLFNTVVIVLLGFEVIYISIQAARGMLSHFNIANTFYSAMYMLMAFAATAVTLYTAYIGYLFFIHSFTELPAYYVWAIRLSIILFVAFALEGFVMGSRLSHSIGGPDGSKGIWFLNWSRTLGDARVAHFIGMHALQIIPLLSYYIIKNTKGTIVICLLYTCLALYTLLQALKGKPLMQLTTNTEKMEGSSK